MCHRYGANVSCWMNSPWFFTFLLPVFRMTVRRCLWRENRETQWRPAEKGTLLLNSALKIYCTNIGLWFHHSRHCEAKYSCWWVSVTSDHCPTSLQCLEFLFIYHSSELPVFCHSVFAVYTKNIASYLLLYYWLWSPLTLHFIKAQPLQLGKIIQVNIPHWN